MLEPTRSHSLAFDGDPLSVSTTLGDSLFLAPVRGAERGDEGFSETRLASFTRALVVAFAAERAVGIIETVGLVDASQIVVSIVAILCAVASFARPNGATLLILGIAMLLHLYARFPQSGNHVYLQCLIVFALALTRLDDPDDRRELFAALRWVTIFVFFYAGVQKLVHGYYVRGEVFAFLIANEDRFDALLSPLLSAAEQARFAAFTMAEGEGPYRVTHPLLIAGAHSTYLAEIAVPALMLWARTRTLGLYAALAMLAGIELVARELFFGLLMVNLLFLWSPKDHSHRLEPVLYVGTALLFAVRLATPSGTVF